MYGFSFWNKWIELNWIEFVGHPGPLPQIAKNSHYEIYEKLVFIFSPLLYICLLCDEVSLSWKFGNPEFDVSPPPPQVSPPPPPNDPPNIYLYICFHILDLKFNL